MSPQGLAAFGSMTSKNGKPVALGEEEQQDAQEATGKVLRRSGSIGGNRSLFVNSRHALMNNMTNSPVNLKASVSSGSFTLAQDPNTTLDYNTLKKGANFSRTLAARASATHMDSALSI